MKKLDKPQFILIISCLNKVDNQEVISSSAILFESFKEALEYAREDAKTYKHLVSTYVEHSGNPMFNYSYFRMDAVLVEQFHKHIAPFIEELTTAFEE